MGYSPCRLPFRNRHRLYDSLDIAPSRERFLKLTNPNEDRQVSRIRRRIHVEKKAVLTATMTVRKPPRFFESLAYVKNEMEKKLLAAVLQDSGGTSSDTNWR